MKLIYLGSFPPPYGGVTIKNKMLYDNLEQYVDIEKIDLGNIKKMNLIEILKLFMRLLNPSSAFVIGSASKSRRIFTAILYYVNRKALSRSLLILMGGMSSNIIANDPKYLKWVSKYKQVYVETEGMKSELTDVNLKNVSVFPNCRVRPKEKLDINIKSNQKIKCLFFSLISKDKGADIVIETANLLKKRGINFTIDFFGHIEEKYKLEFEAALKKSGQINYCGVFRADKDNVYKKLQEYDLLLFPTRWKAEGVPGILVESKIAGLPAVVSDLNYNAEIIEDSKTGIVLKENTSFELANVIESLYKDRRWLIQMQHDSKVSSEGYLIENHIKDIVNMFK
ncbi:glycosyltransferase [Bacillus sp. ISL-47]|uniref:glycosyltransferase n=1 Tax=Bacillus sp. ISL-47 TaxID=2819130 RepID=UPI001BE79DFC|nr:glycosyltransferase [Bacillus sp. ISL-47]MBT2689222.1 glycosyltransferase [Bacillus sp. ISL-47]MBT2708657.1 glycosyltransferase [Pseudomonas sp. ISL-84]